MDEKSYIPAFQQAEKPETSAWLLAIENRKILMKTQGEKLIVPERDELKSVLGKEILKDEEEYIGSYDGHDCYCIRLDVQNEWQDGFILVDLRELTPQTEDPGLFILAGAANHILHWRSMNQFCGRCGHKTRRKADERAFACDHCGNVVYPRISPATITAILRGDEILLAHNRNFAPGLFSLIAGYVEPGESLEQCVEREIQEEVGIKVKNIRYFSSQPWSFPDSLMMAFIADYDSGEISVDQTEIMEAGWYRADNLPLIPSTDSVAGKMIRWFRDSNREKNN